MAKLYLRQKAIDDLSSIWNYSVEAWSIGQANDYYGMLKTACLQIAANPKIGRNYDDGLMGFKVGKHVIFYSSNANEEVDVLRILHQRMDLKNKLGESCVSIKKGLPNRGNYESLKPNMDN